LDRYFDCYFENGDLEAPRAVTSFCRLLRSFRSLFLAIAQASPNLLLINNEGIWFFVARAVCRFRGCIA
jgi:hypothetical protein